MPRKASSPQVRESRHMASAVQRVTGEWFCQAGNHYTKAVQLQFKGRRICAPCRKRLQSITPRKGVKS